MRRIKILKAIRDSMFRDVGLARLRLAMDIMLGLEQRGFTIIAPSDEPRCPTCGARELAHCVGTKRGQVCEWEKRR